jgi:hydrogenase nickel incorporation protein HypA/HybF
MTAMHELGLCTSIVDAIERRAGDRSVARVRVRVGRLHHVHPEAFDQSFAVAAMGTVAEDATADLVLLSIQARCATCGATWDCDEIPVVCDDCGSVDIELSGGDELVLESIEYRKG